MGKRLCERALNWIQIIDHKGTVRLCSWMRDNNIGSLSCQTISEIYHGKCANRLREKLMANDYSLCDIDACPYLAMNEIDKHMIEIDQIPKYPEELYLAFENVCNYHCISCTIHDVMLKNEAKDLEKDYDKIEEQIKELLPHLKKISANGLGELFCSKRILKLLAEWSPIAPAEEITVLLETNGSLFDEIHWKQIENLGQYNLYVAITIMSFNENTYHYLSGTKFPISQLESNLRFVKELREQGIINHLQLATVVQERNFRTLPEFTRRCIQEFGADSVRLRPYEPWGSQEPEIEWFMDIRNPKHPYYFEYKEVMKNEIFQHPKVEDWSGGHDTFNLREFPYRTLKWSQLVEKCLTDIIVNSDTVVQQIKKHMMKKYSLIIYGFGNMGKVLAKLCMEKGIIPICIVDKNKPHDIFEGIEVYNLKEASILKKKVMVLITPLRNVNEIKKDLEEQGFEGAFICIKDLLNNSVLAEKLICD